MIQRRTVLVAGAAAVGLAPLAACGSSGSGDSGSTIKVGVNYELSGDVATYGQASVQGIEMAIEEVNAAGGVKGKKIELVKYDNKSDPAEATTLATKLMSQDKVLAVIGPATSGAVKATVPIAIRSKVPVVSGSATAEDVTKDASGVKEYAFRTCFADSFQGTAMAVYAASKLAARTAVIFKDSSSDYAKGLAENFRTTFTSKGGTIVAEEAYSKGDKDFNAVLTRIKGQAFDVVYLPGYYQEVGLIVKAARALGITAPVLGGDGYDSPDLVKLAGAASLTDVYYTNHYSALDQDPKVTEFVTAFQKKYNADPGAFQALGYDTAKVVADALSRASELKGEAVKNALAETKDFPAVTGKLSIDANHNPVKDIVVIKLANGAESSSEKVQV
ncbi:MAG: ABC transporter substrate-binding protein [Actinomycetia bacterium]|nr:ABC transporter substrate-binding protein [Actinomycetes bacterium]